IHRYARSMPCSQWVIGFSLIAWLLLCGLQLIAPRLLHRVVLPANLSGSIADSLAETLPERFNERDHVHQREHEKEQVYANPTHRPALRTVRRRCTRPRPAAPA